MDLNALHGEALAAARQIPELKERSGEIAGLAMLRPVDARTELIDESVEIARQIEDPRERSRALTFALVASTKTVR